MTMAYFQIIDANLARLGEGLRVIEDVCRFELANDALTNICKTIRNQLKNISLNYHRSDLINSRSVKSDTRAKSIVPKRSNTSDLLTANVKRVAEACRSLEECTHNQQFSDLRYDIYNLEQAIWKQLSRLPLNGPGIYAISDKPDHLINCAKKDYVPIVQYRNKAASKAEIYTICTHLSKQLRSLDVLFIINDFFDISVDVGADGVHVGQDDIPTPAIRSIIGETKIIGRTTHNINQGKTARDDGADYISVGPIWETPSKPNRPAIGFDYLKNVQELNIPFVAIGGINLTNINEILPYSPPLIGAIRSTSAIENLWKNIKNN